jgi:HlyD family secretion protein
MHSFWKSKLFLSTIMIAIIVALFFWFNQRPETDRYRSEALERGDIVQNVSANGTLNPVTLVSVGTQVSGTITAIHADYNDRVEKGQILVQLDDALLKAALAQSEANAKAAQSALAVAKSDVERVMPLVKDGFISQQDLDKTRQALRDAEAKVTQTQSQVAKDRANLSYAIIRSPVSGVVVSRAVDAGQTVAASFNTPELFKIAQDLREMQIDAYFAEADIGQIHVGQTAKFRVDAFAGQRFNGTVKQLRLNPKTDSNVVTYDVVISVENPDEKLLPGMTAYVDIAVQRRKDVVRIPNTALRFRPENEKDIAEKTPDPKKSAANTSVKSVGSASAPSASTKKETDATSGATARRKNGGTRNGADTQNMGRVYVWREDKLHPITLKTGITDRRYTELLSTELKAGDQVVVEEGSSDKNTSSQKRGMQFGM